MIQNENPERGTAVLGHVDLKRGDTYDIENLVHHRKYVYLTKDPKSGYRNNNYDFGMVLVSQLLIELNKN